MIPLTEPIIVAIATKEECNEFIELIDPYDKHPSSQYSQPDELWKSFNNKYRKPEDILSVVLTLSDYEPKPIEWSYGNLEYNKKEYSSYPVLSFPLFKELHFPEEPKPLDLLSVPHDKYIVICETQEEFDQVRDVLIPYDNFTGNRSWLSGSIYKQNPGDFAFLLSKTLSNNKLFSGWCSGAWYKKEPGFKELPTYTFSELFSNSIKIEGKPERIVKPKEPFKPEITIFDIYKQMKGEK